MTWWTRKDPQLPELSDDSEEDPDNEGETEEKASTKQGNLYHISYNQAYISYKTITKLD